MTGRYILAIAIVGLAMAVVLHAEGAMQAFSDASEIVPGGTRTASLPVTKPLKFPMDGIADFKPGTLTGFPPESDGRLADYE